MISYFLSAVLPGIDFSSPGYSSGTELPPVPVDNSVSELPLNSSMLDSEYLKLAIAVICIILAVVILILFIRAVRKNMSMSDFAGFEETVEEQAPEVVREQPRHKKSQGSKLSAPANLKSSIKGFLERTQNL